MNWFFLDGQGSAILVEFDDAIPTRIAHLIGEDDCAFYKTGCLSEHLRQAVAEKDVVAQDQTDGVTPDEGPSHPKGIRQPQRAVLLCIGESQTPLASVSEQTSECRQVLRGADDKDLTDPSQHQHRERV